jgi:hypothetical protein
MNPDERYRRDLQAYGPEIAGRLRDGGVEASTERLLREDADNLEARYQRAGVGSLRGVGRNFDEAAADFLRQHDAGLAAADAAAAPDLCPQCGAYWACDCTADAGLPETFMGRPVRYTDDVPPGVAIFEIDRQTDSEIDEIRKRNGGHA